MGKPYKHLAAGPDRIARQLARYHLAAASKLAAEADGGLNIEGLAATPEGQLLIGFRNPLPDERALVVPLENPGEVVDGKRAKLGEAYELNLGRRGVRSIELGGRTISDRGRVRRATKAASRCIAGPASAATPQNRSTGSISARCDPKRCSRCRKPRTCMLLSDDGGVVNAGVECKKLPAAKQSFQESASSRPERRSSVVRTDARRSRRRPLRAAFAAADTYRMHRTPLGQRVQRFRFAAYLWLALVLCAAAREADPSWLPWLCAALLPVLPWLLRAGRAMFGAAVDDVENLFTPFVVAVLGLPPLPSVATIGALLTGDGGPVRLARSGALRRRSSRRVGAPARWSRRGIVYRAEPRRRRAVSRVHACCTRRPSARSVMRRRCGCIECASDLRASRASSTKQRDNLSRYVAAPVCAARVAPKRRATPLERRWLTVAFVDISDFTALTERLEPEDLTNLLDAFFAALVELASALRRQSCTSFSATVR